MATNISALKDKVYAHFKKRAATRTIITQEDVLRSGLIDDGERQMEVFRDVQQALVHERLWNYVTENNEAAWRVRTPEDAKKYRSLKGDEELVYGLIDEAGRDGIWSKTLRSRLNIHETHLTSAIKHLTSKSLIKEMRSVENANRKMYIKAEVEQSERSKGGVWYTDGELDEFFVATIAKALEEYILRGSLYRTSKAAATYGAEADKPTKQPKKTKKVSAEEAKALRDKAFGKKVKTEEGLELTQEDYNRIQDLQRREIRYEGHIPMPAGYQNYPTVDYLTELILDLKLTEEVMTSKDLKELLDVMVWDGKIEEVSMAHGTVGYKTARQAMKPETVGPYNALTDAPCGRCPVFNLCEEGGPVGPSNCEYFHKWLTL